MKKNIFIFFVTVISFVFCFSLLGGSDFFRTGEEVNLEILFEGDKNINSLGSEVWINEIKVNNKKVSWLKCKLDNWEIRDNSIVTYNGKPAVLSWRGDIKDNLEINFTSHEWSEIVKVSLDGETEVFDLFSKTPYQKIYKVENKMTHFSFSRLVFYLFLSVFFIIFLYNTRNIFKKFFLKSKNKRRTLFKYFIFIFTFIISLLFLLAFFPGIMTNDSFDQWNQSSLGSFSNIHPAFHTMILFVLKKVWNYPAVVSIFHVLFFSFIFTFGCLFLFDNKLNKNFLYLYSFLVANFPVVGIMLITLWKDVLYSISFLWLTILLLKFETEQIKFQNLLIIPLFLVGILRQNGILILMITTLCMLIRYFRRKGIWKIVVSTWLIFIFIKIPFYNFFKVPPTPDYLYYFTQIQGISSVVVNKNSRINEEEKLIINNLLEENLWQKYYSPKTSWYYFISPEFNLTYLSNNKKTVNKLFVSLMIKNPLIFLKNFYDSTSYLWIFENPLPVTYETTKPTDESNLLTWDKYDLRPNYLLPGYRNIVIRVINKIKKTPIINVVLQPAFYLYLFIFTFILFFYKNNYRYFIFSIPSWSSILSFLWSPSSPEFRYIFPIMLTSLFLLPLSFIKIFKK